MKVIDHIWFTGPRGTVGIIQVEVETKPNVIERRIYVGRGEGYNEAMDIAYICDYGTPLTIDQLKQLTNFLESKKD